MSEVETKCIESYSYFKRATNSSTEVSRVLESCAINDPKVPDK